MSSLQLIGAAANSLPSMIPTQLESVRGRMLAIFIGMLVFGACSPERILTDDVAGEDDAVLADAEPHASKTLRVLKLRTFDGSGQTVHPDFAQMSTWPNPFLLVATPYTNGSVGMENPSLYSRDSDFAWTPVGNRSSPIALPTDPSKYYLSDPDIVAIPSTGEVWVYYRQVDTRNTIYLIRTRDGVEYSEPVVVVAAESHSIVSPAVVRRDSTRWRMWSVNGGKEGCWGPSTSVQLRRSRDGQRWGKPVTVSLEQRGAFVWHIDVQWIPSRKEYWALYNVKTPGNCATLGLYLATSPDGVTWKTYPSPVLFVGAIPEFSDIVYRSTFSYYAEADKIRFWYSGAHIEDGVIVWRTAYDRRDRAEVFSAIGAEPDPAFARRAKYPRPIFFNPP